MSLEDECGRQVDTLLDSGFPATAGMSTDQFVSLLTPLKARLADLPGRSAETSLPFVIVVKSALVPTEAVMHAVVDGEGERGLVNMTPIQPGDFAARPGTQLPAEVAYLITDVDTGAGTLNVRPRNALSMIEAQGRLPLTTTKASRF